MSFASSLAINVASEHGFAQMDLERGGNFIEAGIWFLLAMTLLVYALRTEQRERGTLIGLAAVLAIFGLSDLVEARTGAWWKPWWLFVWKALCVLALTFGFWRYYRMKKVSRSAVSQSNKP
jgi:hypothetical protein